MTSECSFRTQLVFREQRLLYDYWRSCADTRPMPSRGDIDPTAMRECLPYICLIDILDGLPNAVVRLAGTSVRDVYGFELTGKCLGDLEWGERGAYWQDVYRRILDKAAPLQGAIQGPISKREHITMFWLRLPLSDDGERVNKILCYDVAVPSNPAFHSGQDFLNSDLAVNG